MNLKTLKKYSLILAFIWTFSSSLCFSQSENSEIKEDFQASTKYQPGKEFPQVNSQGYARFRVEAPQADRVRVSFGLARKGGTKLIKSDEGVWTGTTEGPIDEGFHY